MNRHTSKLHLLACLVAFPVTTLADDLRPLKLHDARLNQVKDLSTHTLKNRYFPFNESNDTVDELKLMLEEKERQRLQSVRDPEKQQRTMPVSLSINGSENEVFASVNFQTNLVFVDRTGHPWPITHVGVGASEFFDVVQYAPHAVEISPNRKYSKTNLTIWLDGEDVPLMFTLKEDMDVVDYLTQVQVTSVYSKGQVSEYQRPIQQSATFTSGAARDPHILKMRDGITPEGGVKLAVTRSGSSMPDLAAWQYGGDYFVKTQGELIVPKGDLVGTGVDGIKLFKIPPVSSMMLELNGGLVTNVRVAKP